MSDSACETEPSPTNASAVDTTNQSTVSVVEEGDSSVQDPNQSKLQSVTDTPSTAQTSPPQTAVKATSVSSPKPKVAKVDILLKPAGDAPIMKQKKWAVERTKRVAEVSSFIKKYIKSDASESLFLYVNQAFAPPPDVEVGTVFDCFGSDGKLVLHYCKTQAWG